MCFSNYIMCLLQVDTQEYAFTLRKNSSWSIPINRALNTAIDNGVVSKSYREHLVYSCLDSSQDDQDSVKPLGLSNLGILFIISMVTALFLSIVKIWPIIQNRNRPRLPLRSLSADDVISRPPPLRSSFSSSTRLSIVSSSFSSPGILFSSRRQSLTKDGHLEKSTTILPAVVESDRYLPEEMLQNASCTDSNESVFWPSGKEVNTDNTKK